MKKVCEELRRVGKTSPELLKQRLEAVGLTDLELLIMKLRYIDGLLFKQIKVGISERQMFKVHKKAIEKTVAKLKLADWLGFFVQ